MSYTKILRKADDYISSFYMQHAKPTLFFHTYPRLTEVVAAGEKLSRHYHLDERQSFIVAIACWFHHTGFVLLNTENPEVKSAEIASHFLKNAGAEEEDITEVDNCILATKNGTNPVTLSEKIVHDAVTFYLGTAGFKASQKLLRKELEAVNEQLINPNDWVQQNIQMLEEHQYYTDYCKLLLGKTKSQHAERLKKKMNSLLSQQHPSSNLLDDSLVEVEEANKEQTKSPTPPEKKPTRGRETMFRISSSNSLKISEMADNKAHIMISVNSIIISVVLGLIVGKLDENRVMIVPTIILLSVNVFTIIYSVLATRPKVTRGSFTPEELERKTVNLLFYGSFYKMDFSAYDNAMRKLMDDREFLYGSLIKDIYWQGKVLGRKYKFLRLSYNIFMYGIALSVIAYSIATIFTIHS